LKSLSILKNIWNLLFKKISLDWVTKLSLLIKNDQKFNSILIIIYYIIKYVLFILIQNDSIAVNFIKLFFKHIKYYFDFSRSIVTNRDSCIISDFWWEVCEIKMIKQCLSTAYHSQINSQNEALNQIIKNYLHVYTSEDQTV